MDYGNTIADVKPLGKFCLLIGVLCYPISVVYALLTGLWDFMPWRMIGYVSLSVPVFFGALILPTTMFCIRVKDGLIQYLFLKRFILRQKNLADLVSLDISNKHYPAVFGFNDGSTLCFQPGAHVAEIARMADDIEKLTNGRVKII